MAPGQTAPLTYAALVPHNDYLRVLAEYGPFNLIIFVGFLLHVRRGLTTGATKVLFVVLCVYFFSENLLDNFTSMAIYFAYARRVYSVVAHGPFQGANRNPNRSIGGLADSRGKVTKMSEKIVFSSVGGAGYIGSHCCKALAEAGYTASLF